MSKSTDKSNIDSFDTFNDSGLGLNDKITLKKEKNF